MERRSIVAGVLTTTLLCVAAVAGSVQDAAQDVRDAAAAGDAGLGCNLLNQMLEMGRPRSVASVA